jgi:uncharacterized protein
MSLLFNVSQFLKADVGGIRTYDFSMDEPLDLDGDVATGICGTVKFTLNNFGILATVQAHADVHLTCARCLEPFQTPIDVAFQEEYRPVIDVATGMPSRLPESDTAFQISPNHMLDLGEAVRQQLLLGLEIIPVCGPECKGLCPTCGANLNTEQCACPPAEPTNPFAVLAALLTDADDRPTVH